jgi:hypothetical protein
VKFGFVFYCCNVYVHLITKIALSKKDNAEFNVLLFGAVMKRTALALIFILVLLVTSLLVASIPSLKADAEALQLQWQQFLPGISGTSVIQTSDGGYLALGINASIQENDLGESVFTNREPILIKTDSSGNIIWTKTYQAEDGRLELSEIIETNDGGYALGGVRVVENVYLNAENKIILMKLDSQGNVQWEKLFIGYNDTYSDTVGPSSIGGLIQTSDQGFVIVSGYVHTMYVNEIWFAKTDAEGNLELNKTISGGLISIVSASDGGFAVISQLMGRGGGSKFMLVKIDSEGNMQWTNTYIQQDSISSYATCGIATRDGGYSLGGYAILDKNYGWLVKTDSQGNMLWNKICSYKGYSSTIRSILKTDDGGFFYVGDAVNQTRFGEFDSNTRVFTWIVKTDNLGNVQSEAAIAMGNHFTSPTSVIQANDGGYVFVGTWNESDPATSDQRFWFVKIAPTQSPSTTPTITPYQEPQQTPQLEIIIGVAVAVAVIGAGLGLLLYLIKRK